jgi:hypothetical protein
MPRKSLAQEEGITNGIVFGARERRKPLEERARRDEFPRRKNSFFRRAAFGFISGFSILPQS